MCVAIIIVVIIVSIISIISSSSQGALCGVRLGMLLLWEV